MLQLLWQGYNRFYQRLIPVEVTQRTWARFFDAHEPVFALVAEREQKVAGLAHYLFHRTTAMLEPTCHLQDLFTEQSSRGEGIGRALIERVCERAKAAGARRIYWHTHEANLAARALYDKVTQHSGFIVYGKATNDCG